MTAYFTEGQSDPTVQPVPASVVEQVDAADTTLQNPKRAVLSLGSNLGNRLETLQGSIDALEDTPGVRVKAVSPVYETEPWGVEPGSQPTYFNAVVVLKTTLPPSSLLERAHAIEEAFHRVRDERWGPRTIDVDIVAYADVVSGDPVLTLPHPHAHERAFVLAPWHDVEPEAQLPDRGPVAHLLTAVTREGVLPRPDLELRLPE
ncbi:2-amino-4-hydroxy-6-hydroxymethyldihydropteridine diphosphokinase [Streptomyces sp. NPDC059837]|jgi:2-amino-4-hydroxy-6-hydroxymethyldihydropteridine diphosphokinase|uniref:2-amino-4-hydroxy-6- hydroxymethyldihydropteridine diphosphokinase n=1 Tax=unclassified Streptomyces TaxID=2593676 RepID=UPI002252ACC4|nr:MULTISPECIES: 2-amino-4-hydroxy-6-hydroxymethyldihydropteridine diphosphokinase [unclassified Streptomyces]MCX4411113.1 2-amino-4-hydroxy-6-hydroxymethyldihydropteridine diphosphokinase [Streptomyces sp. NBC_01764]MCX4455864.1 2-amino-4-hydroxy-6-hydroxymethyldihydropteridine diphosphokinase [Streptomyces sp. NBC_01719]MCX4495224.1 2-amino-4-hydroxy-6-hydroxymethyldihydropteridine diphosphokinase [Streptomyces sp. NBC_01728]MCX4590209.1 2-amino-4-hydroxy-6-hydroxymethyldihydropteridine dipho